MGKKEKTFLEEAASNRRFAKGLRIYGIVLYVLSAAAAVTVVWMFVGGHTSNGIVTSVSTLVIAFWGWFTRHVQAPQSDDIAESYERMEVRYGYLVSAAERDRRQADLHRLAVARRRKAKRGGKR